VPQYLHIALTPVDAVHIGSSVELKLIISKVWQEIWWLNFYTQIILRNKRVHSPVCLQNQQTVFTFIFYRWRRLEMLTEF